jgi:hypothetical protein
MTRALACIATVLMLSGSGPPLLTTLPGPPTAAELDTLMAPVALYPDQLLAEMLMATANPAMIGTLNEWLRSQTLKGSDLQDAAVKSGFDGSFVALVLFPDVVEWMASRPDWTAKVGAAFAADRSSVFDSIQRLRAKAQAAGKLKTTSQQQVETQTTSNGQQVIVIEPSNPQVVYVPQYNPQVVYTQPASTTVVVEQHDDDAEAAVAAGMIGFTAGVAIGAAFDNNYYYGPYGWHGGGYMYNDAWDDYYDAREDAREDWQDYREDVVEERGDRAQNAQEQRTERRENTQQQRTDRQQTTQQRTEREQTRSGAGSGTAAATTSAESRGFSRDTAQTDRSGTRSDAFSGYSSGRTERAASERGQRSRSSSRSSGSRRR